MTAQPDDFLWQRLAQHAIPDLGGAGVFAAKLRRQQGWSRAYCARAIEDYRRFCYLSVRSASPMSPSPDIDAVWHLHLTHTRDYWQRFCPEVLGLNLHHEPASPGVADRAALAAQYASTLSAYQQAFGVPPAEDLWPGFVEQDQQSRSQRTVDTRRFWLLPRPTVWLRRWWLALGAAVPGTAAALDANPLQWSGPEFLMLFILLTVIVAIVRARIERRYRDAGNALPGNDPTPAEIALLAGGTQRVVDLVANALVERKALQVEGQRLKTPHGAVGQYPLESALLSVCTVPRRPSEIGALLAPALRDLERGLERRRLWLSEVQLRRVRGAQLWLVGGLWLLGAAKIGIGLQGGRPVLWLVLLMVVVSFGLLGVLFDRDRRSLAGMRLLRDWKRNHATLARASSGGDQALAAALFGLGALTAAGAVTAYTQLRQPVAPTGSATDGSASGCTSAGSDRTGSDSAGSDSGGSGCSSGCGGCGGGGGD